MKHRQVTEQLLNVARQYQQDIDVAAKYYEKQNLNARLNHDGNKVDARDFVPMVTLLGIKGNTPQERTADIHKKMDELAAAFENPDHSVRDQYLNKIYDLMDTFDPATMDMSNPLDAEKMIQCTVLTQTFGTKKDENPEYYGRRYPTAATRTIADARDNFLTAAIATVSTNLRKNNISFNTVYTPPTTVTEDLLPFHRCREEYNKLLLDKAVDAKGAVAPTTMIDLPVLDSMLRFAYKNVANVPKYSYNSETRLHTYDSLVFRNSLLPAGNRKVSGLKEAGLEPSAAIYIDGKPIDTYIQDRFPKDKRLDIVRAKVIGTCLLNGNHRVDIVHTYRNENGEMQYEPKTVRAHVTPEQEKLYMQQFTWIRRTLFNWGPFRIEPLREKLDRIANDPNTQARHASIVKHHKATIETRIAEKAKAAAAEKKQPNKLAATRAAIKKETELLVESAKHWDKDSAIGILGQQITGVFDVKGQKATGAYNAIRYEIVNNNVKDRYDKLSTLFAKTMLYFQLCSDRKENDGQPGEVEKHLGTGDAIQENIENTAQLLAQAPVFKNFFLEKLGSEESKMLCPNLQKFENMIASGGCDRFRMEYLQRLKDMDNEKEQQAPSHKKELEKQTTAPVKGSTGL